MKIYNMLSKKFEIIHLEDVSDNHLFLFNSVNEFNKRDQDRLRTYPASRALQISFNKYLLNKIEMVEVNIKNYSHLLTFPCKGMTSKDILEYTLDMLEQRQFEVTSSRPP